MNMVLRPKRSATLPKKRSKEPEESLPITISKVAQGVGCFKNSIRVQDTHAEEALIHVISAFDMFKSFPINDVMTVMAPIVNEFMAIAIVAVRTKSIS
jgi:hypothetical protein